MKKKRMTAATILACVLASASLVGAQTLQMLCSFNGNNGASPVAGLTLGSDGNFYGTTAGGGSGGYGDGSGTVLKVTTNGTLTTLVSFAFTNGAEPLAGLTLGSDGNFYGTTAGGGNYGGSYGDGGTMFKVTTNGTLTTLVNFNGSNGASYPQAALTLGSDGNFYGTTYYGGSGGGSDGFGTVFKVATNGTLTTLVNFNYSNGANPQAALTLGTDGNFYGTTAGGGATVMGQCYGTVFKVTTNGTLTTLVNFNGTDGSEPTAALTLGTDGNFYGTTSEGGSSPDDGTVFKVTTNGTLTTLVNFNGKNGANPTAALTLGNDGNFYGTTYGGGSGYSDSLTGNYGTVFKLTTNGTLTTLVSFAFTNGANPCAGLTLGNDGNFYGMTEIGGNSDDGTVFRLLLPPVPPTLTLQFMAGCPQLNLAGTLGKNFVVQYSTNLAGSNWINLLSVTNLSASPYLFLDTSEAGQAARFYRAFMQ